MAETRHTPEPWRMEERERIYVVSDAPSPDRGPICVTSGFVRSKYVSEANARRIAACVNACKGIPTEELEANPALITQSPAMLAALFLANRGLDNYNNGPQPEEDPEDPIRVREIQKWKAENELHSTAHIAVMNALESLGIDYLNDPRCNEPEDSVLRWISPQQVDQASRIVGEIYGHWAGQRFFDAIRDAACEDESEARQ